LAHPPTSDHPPVFAWLLQRRKRVISALGLILIAGIVCYLFFDRPAARWADTLNPTANNFWEIVTRFGLTEWYIVPAAILLICYKLITKHPMLAWRSALIVCSIAGSGLIANLFKWILGRYRPPMLLEENLFGFSFFKLGYMAHSFPSGHSTTAGALIVLACVFMPKGAWLWIVMGVLIAASRAFICVHYLSDVIAGLTLGGAFTLWVNHKLTKPIEAIPAK